MSFARHVQYSNSTFLAERCPRGPRPVAKRPTLFDKRSVGGRISTEVMHCPSAKDALLGKNSRRLCHRNSTRLSLATASNTKRRIIKAPARIDLFPPSDDQVRYFDHPCRATSRVTRSTPGSRLTRCACSCSRATNSSFRRVRIRPNPAPTQFLHSYSPRSYLSFFFRAILSSRPYYQPQRRDQ